MGGFSALATEISDFEDRLGHDAAHLVEDFRSLIGKLTGQPEAETAEVAKHPETTPDAEEAVHGTAKPGV